MVSIGFTFIILFNWTDLRRICSVFGSYRACLAFIMVEIGGTLFDQKTLDFLNHPIRLFARNI